MRTNVKITAMIAVALVSVLLLSSAFNGAVSDSRIDRPDMDFSPDPDSSSPPSIVDLDNGGYEGDEETVLFKVYQNGKGTSYIRNGVFLDYKNGKWEYCKESESQVYNGSLEVLNQPPLVTNHQMTIEPVSAFDAKIPVPKDSYRVSVSDSVALGYDAWAQVLSAENGKITYEYTVKYYIPDENSYINALRSDSASSNPEYLRMPADLSAKIKDLALDIVGSETSDYEKAVLIRDYLKTNYVYNLNYRMHPQGTDPLDWFLFGNSDKDGICTHFNTAFVMLARSLGMSARLVSGYLIDSDEPVQEVTVGMGHAYSEKSPRP